jgi:Subtilase family
MTARKRQIATLITVVAGAFAPACAPAAAAGARSPLPASDYGVRSVCPAPAPGHASCMAQRLVARTAQTRARLRPLDVSRRATPPSGASASEPFVLGPAALHSVYSLPTEAGSQQTIALVDAYNDLTIEADLARYDHKFSLPECTVANGCFEKINEDGQPSPSAMPFPQSENALESEEQACTGGEDEACELVKEARGWTIEISLDVETAHAICQKDCKIVLVEAESPSYADLATAELTAAESVRADEISNSWGGPECREAVGCEEAAAYDKAFDHPGIVITASAGDDGFDNWLEEEPPGYANFPASSEYVIAVGGTRLAEPGPHGEWAGETVWNDGGVSEEGEVEGFGASGGGCSVLFDAQPWQQETSDWSAVGCGSKRAVADVSADADPLSGVAVNDSSANAGECDESFGSSSYWCAVGGTSLASPLVAATFALAGGAHGVAYPARTLYENATRSPSSLHEVTEGSNGECLEPFDEETYTAGCTPAEEAQASCASKLICEAGTGYAGPTGVGTPDGIGAFQPPAGGEKPSEGGDEPSEGGGSTQGSSHGPLTAGSGAQSALAPPPVLQSVPSVRLSGLALTLKALVALNTAHPKIPKIGFTFVSNMLVRVTASLRKRVGGHRHAHWETLGRPLHMTARPGRNSQHLAAHGTLSAGTYRLLLTPQHGDGDSLTFQIG